MLHGRAGTPGGLVSQYQAWGWAGTMVPSQMTASGIPQGTQACRRWVDMAVLTRSCLPLLPGLWRRQQKLPCLMPKLPSASTHGGWVPSRHCSRGVHSSPPQMGAQPRRGEGFGRYPTGSEGLGHGALRLAPDTATASLLRWALPSASSLFTLTVEQELEGGRHQRSALRILAPGGAIGPCPKPYVLQLHLCTGAEPRPLWHPCGACCGVGGGFGTRR